MLADVIIWTLWKQYNAAGQQNKAHKQGSEANKKRLWREREKRGIVRILPNTKHKYLKNK